MKKNFKLLGTVFILSVAMIACENNEQDLTPAVYDLKKANNGMIKSYDNSMVIAWNEALSNAIDNKMPIAAESRIYAMVSLAVHDALNNVVPQYETYVLDNSAVDVKDISKKNIHSIAHAAVAQAAHDAMVALVPASAANAGTLLTSSLSGIADSNLKDRGIQIGKDAALSVLAERQGDPPLGFAAYPQGTEPGEYRSTLPYLIARPPVWPANAVYAPNMGTFNPFGIEASDQFRAQPPYEVNSPEYTADYNEVKRLGGEISLERTQEQKDLGIFYLDNVSGAMNRVARIIAVQDELDGWEAARLFALTHMTQFDALLSSFESTYYYNRWRPVTAIQSGDTDGNDDTDGDPAWISVVAARANPPTPAYPATYAEMAGAGAELFRLFFKKDDTSFTTVSFNLPGVERSYSSFSDFASDICISRIYVGFQFRNDIEEGEKIGREIANYVFENNLGIL